MENFIHVILGLGEKIMVLEIVDVLIAVDIKCASLPKSRGNKNEIAIYINMYNAILHVVNDQAVILTFTPKLLLADMYMFGLSSGWLTKTGSCICRELSISA